MTAPARSREEAHEMLEVAIREGEERCLGALQLLVWISVNQPRLRFSDLMAVAEHWRVANDQAFRSAVHDAVDSAFDAIEEAA